MDLDALCPALSDEGAWMDVLHPVTKEPVKGMRVKLAGPDSERYLKAQHTITNRYLQKRQRGGKASLTQEEIDSQSVELLVAVTLDWELARGGKPVPFSPEAAQDIYSDRKFRWLVEQIDAFLRDRSNFMGA